MEIEVPTEIVLKCIRFTSRLVIALLVIDVAIHAQDNGIHVGEPKVYDSRELTLMLDNLSQQLQNKNFIDPKALAAALGNVQGFQNSDFSLGVFGNGGVGSQAAAVFAAAGSGTTSPPSSSGTSTAPTVTVNVAPTLNAGSTGATPTAASTASPTTPLGPQAPALPTLQTPPSYTPTFGSNGSDLLSDEVNLTYQLYNVRMLLDRSLTDRLHYVSTGAEPRLQAVVGFDIDLEPDKSAKDAVAIVDVTAEMPMPNATTCDTNAKPSVVALMPEEGSHNAATLSQKAYAFGGAIAASVFSVGGAAQKRSQVFYLYRDMDTVSYQKPPWYSDSIGFGWQFRPVLGRHSVDPGMRHLIVVIGLPCSDLGPNVPQLKMQVKTSWERYDAGSQTTSPKSHFWSHSLPGSATVEFNPVKVPSSDFSQLHLEPSIDSVRWVPTDATNGVAIVTGKNLFPGTTIRMGGKTYASASDGLTIKSDHELEVTVPLAVAANGGVLSGRYGQAKPLEPATAALPASLTLSDFRLHPMGDDTYELIADLLVVPDPGSVAPTLQQIQAMLSTPVVLVNGVPLLGIPYLSQTPPSPIELTTFIPAAALAKGTPLLTITFPFAGPRWTANLPYYTPTLKIARLGSDKEVRLLISATDAADQLCKNWSLQLDTANEFPLTAADRKCADPRTRTLNFEIPSADLGSSDPALKCVDTKTLLLHLAVPTKDIEGVDDGGCIDSAAQTVTLTLPAKDLRVSDPVRKCLNPKTQALRLKVPAKDLEPPSVALKCADVKTQTLGFDIPANDLKGHHHLMLINREKPTPRPPLVGDIPKSEPPPPGPSLDKDQKVSVPINDVHPVKFTGKHLDEVTKVLFDKVSLTIVKKEDKEILISLSPQITSKVRENVGLQLLSEDNDPVIATFSVVPAKSPAPAPAKKGK